MKKERKFVQFANGGISSASEVLLVQVINDMLLEFMIGLNLFGYLMLLVYMMVGNCLICPCVDYGLIEKRNHFMTFCCRRIFDLAMAGYSLIG